MPVPHIPLGYFKEIIGPEKIKNGALYIYTSIITVHPTDTPSNQLLLT
jgi:hypothetical protein